MRSDVPRHATLLAALAAACGGGDSPAPGFDRASWALIEPLAMRSWPQPPRDVSNRFADDSTAAALGQRLFFDPSFSGPLLDADNTGAPGTLGQRGQTGKVACAGCHIEESGFLDDRSIFGEISLAAGWTRRRTPSLRNVGHAVLLNWGGRHSTLQGQAIGALENPLEMNGSRLYLAQRIAAAYASDYEAIFGPGELAPLADTERFPSLSPEHAGCVLTQPIDHPRAAAPDPIYECHGVPGDGAEYDRMTAADRERVDRIAINVGKALAAFQRQLRCGPGRFDAFVHGAYDALSTEEQRGLAVFVGSGGCVGCHGGPFLSDGRFHNLGVKEETTREGIFNGGDEGAATDLPLAAADRFAVTGPFSDGDDGRLLREILPAMRGAFRTPSLRCVAERPTFMHHGLHHSLAEVVSFFDRGGDPLGYPGQKVIAPLGLTSEQRRDLTAFLEALDATENVTP